MFKNSAGHKKESIRLPIRLAKARGKKKEELNNQIDNDPNVKNFDFDFSEND